MIDARFIAALSVLCLSLSSQADRVSSHVCNDGVPLGAQFESQGFEISYGGFQGYITTASQIGSNQGKDACGEITRGIRYTKFGLERLDFEADLALLSADTSDFPEVLNPPVPPRGKSESSLFVRYDQGRYDQGRGTVFYEGTYVAKSEGEKITLSPFMYEMEMDEASIAFIGAPVYYGRQVVGIVSSFYRPAGVKKATRWLPGAGMQVRARLLITPITYIEQWLAEKRTSSIFLDWNAFLSGKEVFQTKLQAQSLKDLVPQDNTDLSMQPSLGLDVAGSGGGDPLGIGGENEIAAEDLRINLSEQTLAMLPATPKYAKLRAWQAASKAGDRAFLIERDTAGLLRVRRAQNLEQFEAQIEKNGVQVLVVKGTRPSELEKQVRELNTQVADMVMLEQTESVLQQSFLKAMVLQSTMPQLWTPVDSARLENRNGVFGAAWKALAELLPEETNALEKALRDGKK